MRKRIHAAGIVLVTLPSFAGAATGGAQADTAGHVQAALDVLFQASQETLGVTQSIVGSRLEAPLSAELSAEHPYREIVAAIEDGGPARYEERIWSGWTPGHLCAVSEQPYFAAGASSEPPEPLPFAGFYWSSNRGVRINFNTNDSRLFDEFAAFSVQVWPQEFHGFYGVTPLVSMASYAQTIGKLAAEHPSQDVVRLRFPCNPTFSPDFLEVQTEDGMPWVEVDVHVGEGPRILRRRLWTQAQGVLDECVATSWEESEGGRLVPNAVEYRYDLSLFQPELEKTFIVFALTHEITPQPTLDGQSIFDLVKAVGFFSGSNQHLASPVGGDRLVQAAVDTFRGVRDWTLPVKTAQRQLVDAFRSVLAETGERIAKDGASWPGTSQEAIDRLLVEPMQPFDMETKYCSQLGITLLRRLHEHSITFGEVLAAHPADLMPMAEIVESLRRAGLDFEAVRSDDIEDLVDDDPFLMLMGDDSSQGHLGVAVRTDGGGFRIWAPPNENREIPEGTIGEFAPLGIYIVPRAWIGKSSPLAYTLAGCVLGALALYVVLGPRRSKRLAGGAAAACLLIGTTGCGGSAHGQQDAVLIRSLAAEYTCEVGLAKTRPLTVEVENVTGTEVRIVAATPSCACIQYCGADEVRLDPHRSAALPLVVDGTVLGEGKWRLDVVAESPGGSQLLQVPVNVVTQGGMFTVPSSLQWAGRPGDEIEPFGLTAVSPDGEVPGELRCVADFEGADFEVERTGTGRAHGGSASYFEVYGSLPEFAPGTYVVKLTFERDRLFGDEPEVFEKHVPLILTQ